MMRNWKHWSKSNQEKIASRREHSA